MLQTTEVSFSGSGLPKELIIIIALLAVIVVGVIIWLLRSVRKNINADDEWHYDNYSLMNQEEPLPKPQPAYTPPVKKATPTVEPQVSQSVPLPPPEIQLPPEEPEPIQEFTAPTEPIPSITIEPPPPEKPEIIAPSLPPQPPVQYSQPVDLPSPTVKAADGAKVEPQLGSKRTNRNAPLFQTLGQETKPAQRHGSSQLILASIGLLLAAVYFLVFPIQEAVNSTVTNLGRGLSRLFNKPQPVSQDQLTALPQLDVVQDVAYRNQAIVITGRVRNNSSDTLDHLFAELALSPTGIDLMETRLVPIEPDKIAPNEEGTYSIELTKNEFSKYQLARIITADKKEVTFKLLLTFPGTGTPQSR